MDAKQRLPSAAPQGQRTPGHLGGGGIAVQNARIVIDHEDRTRDRVEDDLVEVVGARPGWR
jgi:ribosomal protein L3